MGVRSATCDSAVSAGGVAAVGSRWQRSQRPQRPPRPEQATRRARAADLPQTATLSVGALAEGFDAEPAQLSTKPRISPLPYPALPPAVAWPTLEAKRHRLALLAVSGAAVPLPPSRGRRDTERHSGATASTASTPGTPCWSPIQCTPAAAVVHENATYGIGPRLFEIGGPGKQHW